MAALKGLALGDILEYSSTTKVAPTISDAFLSKLEEIPLKAEVLRLEFRLSHAADWTAPGLIQGYADQITRLNKAFNNPKIIGEITYQSVPGAMQQHWNAQHTEPGPSPAPTMNAFIVRFFEAIQAILTTELADHSHLTDLVQHWEIWNEPNNWTVNTQDPKGNWGATGWRGELGDPATFDPSNLTAAQSKWLAANPTFPLNPLTPGGFYLYPSLYATLLAGGAALIKDLQPEATVIGGGILGLNATTGLPYVNQLLGHLQRLPAAIDGFAQHLYFMENAKAPAATRLADLQTRIQGCLTDLFTLLNKKGSIEHIYVTEAGFSSKPGVPGTIVDNQQAVDDCGALFAACAATPALDSLCWFTLQDSKGITSGLFDTAGNEKPGMVAAFAQPLQGIGKLE